MVMRPPMVAPDTAEAILVGVIGVMVIQGLWLAFLTFTLHRSGLLLKHYTRRLRPNVDSDVLSGMLVAVQEFIKDSFRGEKGGLNEIRFGEIRIVVMEGKWTILAAVVRGARPFDIQPELSGALSELEAKYEDPLTDWDGTMEQIADVDTIMDALIEGKYRGRPPAAQPPLSIPQ